MLELYKRYRPKDFGDIVGQEQVTKPLQKMVEQNKVPHAILLCGSKGTGKTTIGRILRRKLKCSKWDFIEQNCANKRGIESIREIMSQADLCPMKGKTKIWLMDEAHMWTSEASNSFLKILEEPPSHVYFILCTTEPQKLIATIRSRCTEFAFKPLSSTHLRSLIEKIAKAEKIELSEEVIDKIIVNSDNSARNALVLLDKIITIADEEEQLEAIQKASTETAAIEIARTLFNPRASWMDMTKVLKSTETEEPESIRWMILGYAKAILLGGGKMAPRAYDVIQIFRDNWYDCKSAGLISSCFEAMRDR